MCSIDDPDLFSGLLYPLVRNTAIHAVFARAALCQRVDGILAQFGIGTVYVDRAIRSRQCRGNVIACIFHSQACVSAESVCLGIGRIYLPILASDRLVGVSNHALRIALPDHKDQGKRCGGDGNFVKGAVNAHLRRTDTRGDQGVAREGDDRVIQGSLVYTVAHLVGGGGACVDDLHGLASDRVAVVVAEGEGGGSIRVFCTTPGASAVFVGVGMGFLNGNIVGQGLGQVKGPTLVPILTCKSNPSVLRHHYSDNICPLLLREVAQIVTAVFIGCIGASPLHGIGILEGDHGTGFQIVIDTGADPTGLIIARSKLVAMDHLRQSHRLFFHGLIFANMAFHDPGNHFVTGGIWVQTVGHIG